MSDRETDASRELDRFDTFFELETGHTLDREEDLEVVIKILEQWLDNIDVFGETRLEFISTIIAALKKQKRFSKKANERFEKENREFAKALSRKKKWTAKDIRTLQMYYGGGTPVNVISSKLNRSRSAVYHKASRLSIKRKLLEEMT